MSNRTYIPIKPIPIRERNSILFLEYGQVDVVNQAFVLSDANGVRTQIPIGGLACLMLEPGTRVTHAAITLASRVGCLLVWVGEGGVRLYAAGQPGGARADRLLYQAKVALDETARLNVVRKMYAMRFDEAAPERRSIDQLRGMEGARVRETYRRLADEAGIAWHGRRYDFGNWRAADVPNQCLSAATSALYGLTEAAILAAGYAPAIGFLHSGRAQSLLEHWMRQLSKAERAVLECLAGVWPDSLSKQEVAEVAGYEASGGGFNNALSRLRTLELISGSGELKASDDLFDAPAGGLSQGA